MTIEEQLRQIILDEYGSILSFTTSIGVPNSTLTSVFKRGISNAGVSTMLKVFNALNLDIESIADGELHFCTNKKSPAPVEPEAGEDSELTQRKQALLANFYKLNEKGQDELVTYSKRLTYDGELLACGQPGGLAKQA